MRNAGTSGTRGPGLRSGCCCWKLEHLGSRGFLLRYALTFDLGADVGLSWDIVCVGVAVGARLGCQAAGSRPVVLLVSPSRSSFRFRFFQAPVGMSSIWLAS